MNHITSSGYKRILQRLQLQYYKFYSFYRAMHFSAKRGIAIACRLSVRL